MQNDRGAPPAERPRSNARAMPLSDTQPTVSSLILGENAIVPDTHANPPRRRSTDNEIILIVDDAPENLSALGSLLQDAGYREQVLGNALRVGVEALIGFGWERWLGADGIFIGMTGFGASAPAEELYKHFGITSEAVATAVKKRLA